MSYQRNSLSSTATASRRAQRPNSFSGTRSSPVSIGLSSTPSMRNVYSSLMPGISSSYSSVGSSYGGGYPTYPSSLTTYGGTASGYGSLVLPNPNSTYPTSSYHGYHTTRATSPSSYSPRSSWSGTTGYTSSFSSPKTDFSPLNRTTAPHGSTRSIGSEGYVVNTHSF